MGRLDDKVALVTGGAGGIGRATAARFAREGARVVLVDRDEEAVHRAAEAVGHSTVPWVADVGDEAQIEAAYRAADEHFGQVDIVVANAGTEGTLAPLELQTPADFDRVLQVNVRGVWLTFKHGVPRLRARGGGSMIATSSVAGLVGSPGLGPYIASKHAVMGLVKTAALELAADGIRVNAVNPGPVDNRMMRSIEGMANPTDPSAVKAGFTAQVPLGRYATNEDIAGAMLFLASADSSYVTGHSLVVDGGYVVG